MSSSTNQETPSFVKKTLVELGADINTKNNMEETALIMADIQGYSYTVLETQSKYSENVTYVDADQPQLIGVSTEE